MRKFKLLRISSYFFDADSKSEAQQLHKQLEKALDGGKYLLPMLSEIRHCDYSNYTIDFHLKDVRPDGRYYFSPVDIEIHNKTRFNVDENTDLDDWFYDLDTTSMIESLTYGIMPDGCYADFDDMGADIFVD